MRKHADPILIVLLILLLLIFLILIVILICVVPGEVLRLGLGLGVGAGGALAACAEPPTAACGGTSPTRGEGVYMVPALVLWMRHRGRRFRSGSAPTEGLQAGRSIAPE